MKITKTLLTVTSAIALMSIPALADDAQLCPVSNNHGQSVPLFRTGETTIAFYAGGSSVGYAATANETPALTNRDNAHGQNILQFR